MKIPETWKELRPEDFAQPAPLIAQSLIGKVLLKKTPLGYIGGRIIETEAYTEDDPASHSFKGFRPRLKSMFAAPGTLYVYRSYGIHWCLNISTGTEGQGEAVLIRALASDFGPFDFHTDKKPNLRLPLSGPGKLTKVLGIDSKDDGTLLGVDATLHIFQTDQLPPPLALGPRIGISKAIERPWRFGWDSHPELSRPFPKTLLD